MAVLTPASVYAPGRKPPKSEIVQLLEQIMGFAAGPAVVKMTKPQLDATTPASESYGGLVLTGAEAGYYSRASGTWVFGRPFPDTMAEVQGVAGTPNAITGTLSVGVNPGVVKLFILQPVAANTGAVTLNIGEGVKDLVDVHGDAMTAGLLASDRPVMFRVDGADYRLISDPDADAAAAASAASAAAAEGFKDQASTFKDGAEAAADRADDAAAGVEFPVSYMPQALTPEQQAQVRENIGADDAASITALLMALDLSAAKAGPVVLGKAFADEFETLEMVDDAGATNLDTSETGVLKPSLVLGSDITTTGFAFSGGDFSTNPAHLKANAFDNNASSVWISEQVGGAVANTACIGQDFGSGNAKTIRRVTIQQNFDANSSVTSVAIQYGDSGDWTTAATKAITYGATVHTIDVPDVGAHRYWIVRATSAIASPSVGWAVNEVQMMEVSATGSLTVASEIIPNPIVPAAFRVVARVIPAVSITLNTDLMIDVSRNGGGNWTAVSLSEAFVDGGVSVLEADWVDVTGQPSGNEPRWRVRTANAKMIEIDGISLAVR